MIVVLFCVGLLTAFALGCTSGGGGGGGDGDDDGDNTPQTFTASGNYTYNPDTGMLVLTFVVSEFIACGPAVGDEFEDVDSITATIMHWVDDDLTWTRDSGTADDILGTWNYVDEDGNAYEITFNNDGTMIVVADIIDCDDIDVSGTWDLTYTIDLAGMDTNFLCIPGDSEGDDTRSDTVTINQTGNNTFTINFLDGENINGTISGGLYTFSGSWIHDEDDDNYTINISGSFTLNTLNSLTGSDEFSGTNDEGNFCTWDETFIGTKQ
jgi:hypothetical protein